MTPINFEEQPRMINKCDDMKFDANGNLLIRKSAFKKLMYTDKENMNMSKIQTA